MSCVLPRHNQSRCDFYAVQKCHYIFDELFFPFLIMCGGMSHIFVCLCCQAGKTYWASANHHCVKGNTAKTPNPASPIAMLCNFITACDMAQELQSSPTDIDPEVLQSNKLSCGCLIIIQIIGTSMLFLIVHLKSSASASMMVGLYLVRAAFQVSRLILISLEVYSASSVLLLIDANHHCVSFNSAIRIILKFMLCDVTNQNATYPLSESILMDFVAKEFRARWKSLESVVQFGWCGSAVVGGWLGDRSEIAPVLHKFSHQEFCCLCCPACYFNGH